MTEKLKKLFKNITPAVDYCSLRYVGESGEIIRVRQDVLQPFIKYSDSGVMITIIHKGGMGYAGTCDLSEGGLKKAVEAAVMWAEFSAGKSVIDFSGLELEIPKGEYSTIVKRIGLQYL